MEKSSSLIDLRSVGIKRVLPTIDQNCPFPSVCNIHRREAVCPIHQVEYQDPIRRTRRWFALLFSFPLTRILVSLSARLTLVRLSVREWIGGLHVHCVDTDFHLDKSMIEDRLTADDVTCCSNRFQRRNSEWTNRRRIAEYLLKRKWQRQNER